MTNYIMNKLELASGSSSVDRCINSKGTTQILALMDYVTKNYLAGCVTVIFYEKRFEFEEASMNFNLRKFLAEFPEGYINGQVS